MLSYESRMQTPGCSEFAGSRVLQVESTDDLYRNCSAVGRGFAAGERVGRSEASIRGRAAGAGAGQRHRRHPSWDEPGRGRSARAPHGPHGPNVRRVGPYRVEFDEGKVASVAVNLRRNESGIRIGTEEFDDSSRARDVASALPGCKAPEQGRRGMMIECDEGRVLIRMHASCVDFDDAGVCTGYDPRRMGLIVQVRAEAKLRDEAK
jgi:hypothetical protein